MIDSKKKSKASVARDYMKKIGAFSKNPPANWADKVEEHLKEHGFTLPRSSKVQIYAIKSKAMKKSSSKKSSKKIEGSAPISKKRGTVHQISVNELSSAKKYAVSNGGIEKCLEVFKALQLLSN